MVDPDQQHHDGQSIQQSYMDLITAARRMLTIDKNGVLYTHDSDEKIVYQIYTTKLANESLDIIFYLPNLYISGWYNKNNERFVAFDRKIDDAQGLRKPKAEIRLKSTFNYGDLGFQQNQDQNTRKVSMFDVSKALAALSSMPSNQVEGSNWSSNKIYICDLCLGLAEAMRFDSARDNVIKGSAIGDISWNGSNLTEKIKKPAKT